MQHPGHLPDADRTLAKESVATCLSKWHNLRGARVQAAVLSSSLQEAGEIPGPKPQPTA